MDAEHSQKSKTAVTNITNNFFKFFDRRRITREHTYVARHLQQITQLKNFGYVRTLNRLIFWRLL